MERRYQARVKQVPDQSGDGADLAQDLEARVREFVAPYLSSLAEPEQRRHVVEYMIGLLSKLEHKTAEAIAYLLDHTRQGIQKFIGRAVWDHAPMLERLAHHVAGEVGDPDAVIVFASASFPKKGLKSVGVAKQLSGPGKKIENCQVALYMAYVSPAAECLVNTRLYLPKEWTRNPVRRAEARIPKAVRYRAHHELAKEMLQEQGIFLPHSWVAIRDEESYPDSFCQMMRDRGQRYLAPVSPGTWIRNNESNGRKHEITESLSNSFVRLDRLADSLPQSAWSIVSPSGCHGSSASIEIASRRAERRVREGHHPVELFLIVRRHNAEDRDKCNYFATNAEDAVPLQTLASVIHAMDRADSCIQRAREEAGLADYQVRNWLAWHHHQVLSLLAAWFLTLARPKGPSGTICGRASLSRGALEGE